MLGLIIGFITGYFSCLYYPPIKVISKTVEFVDYIIETLKPDFKVVSCSDFDNIMLNLFNIDENSIRYLGSDSLDENDIYYGSYYYNKKWFKFAFIKSDFETNNFNDTRRQINYYMITNKETKEDLTALFNKFSGPNKNFLGTNPTWSRLFPDVNSLEVMDNDCNFKVIKDMNTTVFTEVINE